jgi:hypothetical protein
MGSDNLSGEKSSSRLLPLNIEVGFQWQLRPFGMRSLLLAIGKIYWNYSSLDHSASGGETHVGPARGRPRVNGKSHKDDFHVDESWRLEEGEETALLEVLVAAIRIAKGESSGGKKVAQFNTLKGSFMNLCRLFRVRKRMSRMISHAL